MLAPAARRTRPTPPTDRIEDWIVHALDDESPVSERPTLRRMPDSPVATSDAPQASSWARLHVVRRGGVSVARVAVESLLKPQLLDEVAAELNTLIDTGSARVVLDLSAVERLASAFVATLTRVHRRCATRDGGGFRVCGLRPTLAEVLDLTGVGRFLEVYATEPEALARPWPRPARADILPVSILRALGTPVDAHVLDPDPGPPPPVPAALALRVLSGPGRGRLLPLPVDGATVGRSAACEVHAGDPSLSRRHASLTRTPSGWSVQDLGSTNGTLLNGRRVDAAELLLPGDCLTLGSIAFAVEASAPPGDPDALEALVASWLQPEADPDAPTRDDEDRVAPEPSPPALPEGVRLLAPRVAETDDPELWRGRLDQATAGDPEARVVVDLEHVATLPSRALGILIARALELQRHGGRLRLAHPQAALRARLEWLRVPEVVALFLRVEDAILTAWD